NDSPLGASEKPLGGSDCNAWILENEAELVVGENGPEVEGGRGVVIARAVPRVRESRVALLEPLDAEVSRAHVDGGSVGGLGDRQRQSTNGESIRARRGLEIDIEASGEVGHPFAVDSPPPGPVAFEADFM